MSAASNKMKQVKLAVEADFYLGGLLVSPSTCRVSANGEEKRIEPRVMEVLIVLFRSGGQTVTRDQLTVACWDGRVVSDDAITRVIVKVRQLGRNGEQAHFVLETVSRVGFRLIASSLQKPIAASESAVPAHRPSLRAPFDSLFPRHRTMWIAGITLLVAIGATIAAWSLTSKNLNAGMITNQVAIAPFPARHPEKEVVRLSKNVGEVIAQRLTAAGIPVVLEEPGPDQRLAAEAEFSIAGNVDLVGNTYVIKSSIRDRESGFVLWAGTVERKVDDSPGLDEETARLTAGILDCALRHRKATAAQMSVDVFTLFLATCGSLMRQEERAPEIARRLVEKVPNIARAHAQLALALAERANSLEYLTEEAVALVKEVQESAARALLLNPMTADAHVALGVRIGRSADWANREFHLRRALEIEKDNFYARMHYHLLLREVGRLGAATEMLTGVAETNGGRINSAFLHAMRGELLQAYRLLDQLDVVKPNWARSARWTIVAWWEKPHSAMTILPKLLRAFPVRNAACLEAHIRSIANQNKVLQRGLAKNCDGLQPDWSIRLLARQGDIDGAYALMARALPMTRSPMMFLFYPEMKGFRQDPRFMPLAERLGLLSHWRETNQWPDFCAERDLPYKCR